MKRSHIIFALATTLTAASVFISIPKLAYAKCGFLDITCSPSKWRTPGETVDRIGGKIRILGREFDKQVIQKIGDEIGEGLESAVRMCSQVGVETCMNPNFQTIYRTLKLASSAKIINDANSCGALVKTLADGGQAGLQVYATANGVPVPPQVTNLVTSINEGYGYSSCQLMYGRQPNLSNMVQTKEGAVVSKENLPKITGTIAGTPEKVPSSTTQASNTTPETPTQVNKPSQTQPQSLTRIQLRDIFFNEFINQGYAADKVKPACNCIAKDAFETYTPKQLAQISQNKSQLQEELQPIIKDCLAFYPIDNSNNPQSTLQQTEAETPKRPQKQACLIKIGGICIGPIE
ncbi:MAG: hypothetical protein QNJ36_10765 [Calothrix sp. MO_167.B42]|nr:hypothetical protein [Calothrix sp. MO_167.B42]